MCAGIRNCEIVRVIENILLHMCPVELKFPGLFHKLKIVVKKMLILSKNWNNFARDILCYYFSIQIVFWGIFFSAPVQVQFDPSVSPVCVCLCMYVTGTQCVIVEPCHPLPQWGEMLFTARCLSFPCSSGCMGIQVGQQAENIEAP